MLFVLRLRRSMALLGFLYPSFSFHRIARFQCKGSTLVHFFTSHFFTTLVNEGPNGVSSWTSRKEINIFQKKFIFIPINESLHWSLCVVVNAGNIRRQLIGTPPDDEDEIPFLLFFDSLKAHKKNKVGRKVREWLNFESRRVGLANGISDEPFNEETMKLYDPKGMSLLLNLAF